MRIGNGNIGRQAQITKSNESNDQRRSEVNNVVNGINSCSISNSILIPILDSRIF